MKRVKATLSHSIDQGRIVEERMMPYHDRGISRIEALFVLCGHVQSFHFQILSR